jgi:hypothetical protein
LPLRIPGKIRSLSDCNAAIIGEIIFIQKPTILNFQKP